MIGKPLAQSFWVEEGLLCAGCYPGSKNPAERDAFLNGLLDCGIRRVISLMEPNETSYGDVPFEPYIPRLLELAEARGVSVECLNVPMRDGAAPSEEQMRKALELIENSSTPGGPTYLHCWGGHGRTGTVVACLLVGKGESPEAAMERVRALRQDLPKNHDPFEGGQKSFVRSWDR